MDKTITIIMGAVVISVAAFAVLVITTGEISGFGDDTESLMDERCSFQLQEADDGDYISDDCKDDPSYDLSQNTDSCDEAPRQSGEDCG